LDEIQAKAMRLAAFRRSATMDEMHALIAKFSRLDEESAAAAVFAAWR
jgi:hypothetical protein